MKIAIMQPYFLPYLGYFSLIKNTDYFILFDSVQFIKHGWIERNRILKPSGGWQYVSVSLEKYKRDTKIKEIRINNNINWRDKIFRQLDHYRKRSPFYNETIDVLKEALNIETESIVELNKNILKCVCNYIGVKSNIDIFSNMNLEIKKVNAPDEWALNICRALGNVNEYWNPVGGLDFFNRDKYTNVGIDIKFLKMNTQEYSQKRSNFEPSLSIIDVMMFNEPTKINKMLDDFDLL